MKKKTNNIAQHFAPPVPGMGINLDSATPPQTRTEDAAKLTAMQAARPLFRPHVHAYVKGKCKVCGEPPRAGARP